MLKRSLVGAALVAGLAAAPAAAITVNIHGILDSGANYLNYEPVALAAGTYTAAAIEDLFQAESHWSSNAGCDGAGENCSQGYVVRYAIHDSDGTLLLNWIDPNPNTYFADPGDALASAQAAGAQLFTVLIGGTVYFGNPDTTTSDNRGGVSLLVQEVSDVPLPAAAPLLLLGLGGLAALRRKG
ncbi:VPLPA-CTERM sorting domain-containing protein [Rhodovulum sp. DZ06]|uniref:VPLPA-CTERM sorting domain-containing protein n=1 Tax=Rhodovulum sp. DZ06 TaxID=3425126 RepID=UPI003D34D7E0